MVEDPRLRVKPAFGKMSAEAYRALTDGGGSGQGRSGKFNAVRTEYDGSLYDSKGEAQLAMVLDWRLKAKQIKGYDRQVRLHLVAGIHIVMDFVVENLDGTKQYLDFKGMETPVFKIKRKLFEHFYAPAKIELVKTSRAHKAP